jgi:hypothetical protein
VSLSTDPCAKSFFNQSIWGSLSSAKHILTNPKCVYESLKLGENQADPPGFKLRAAQGKECAGFGVWDAVMGKRHDWFEKALTQ